MFLLNTIINYVLWYLHALVYDLHSFYWDNKSTSCVCFLKKHFWEQKKNQFLLAGEFFLQFLQGNGARSDVKKSVVVMFYDQTIFHPSFWIWFCGQPAASSLVVVRILRIIISHVSLPLKGMCEWFSSSDTSYTWPRSTSETGKRTAPPRSPLASDSPVRSTSDRIHRRPATCHCTVVRACRECRVADSSRRSPAMSRNRRDHGLSVFYDLRCMALGWTCILSWINRQREA